MQIHLNGKDIANREQLHDALSEALELPEWYGRSLDALYDCLTDLSVPTTIHVENWPEEDYMQRALAVLRDRELKERTDKESAPEREPQAERPPEPRHAAANNQTTEIIEAGAR